MIVQGKKEIVKAKRERREGGHTEYGIAYVGTGSNSVKRQVEPGGGRYYREGRASYVGDGVSCFHCSAPQNLHTGECKTGGETEHTYGEGRVPNPGSRADRTTHSSREPSYALPSRP